MSFRVISHGLIGLGCKKAWRCCVWNMVDDVDAGDMTPVMPRLHNGHHKSRFGVAVCIVFSWSDISTSPGARAINDLVQRLDLEAQPASVSPAHYTSPWYYQRRSEFAFFSRALSCGERLRMRILKSCHATPNPAIRRKMWTTCRWLPGIGPHQGMFLTGVASTIPKAWLNCLQLRHFKYKMLDFRVDKGFPGGHFVTVTAVR